MTAGRWFRIVALMAFSSLPTLATGQAADSPDGLVKVAPQSMDLAWLRPGADFRPYTKAIISPTQVAFMPNWRKNYNLNASLGNWVSQEQADKIMAAAQTNFDDAFRDAFRKAGYEVVTAPGEDVLRVNSAIVDLDVNAPLGQNTPGVTWIVTAGSAALIVEVRDSTTHALLGRVADARGRPAGRARRGVPASRPACEPDGRGRPRESRDRGRGAGTRASLLRRLGAGEPQR